MNELDAPPVNGISGVSGDQPERPLETLSQPWSAGFGAATEEAFYGNPVSKLVQSGEKAALGYLSERAQMKKQSKAEIESDAKAEGVQLENIPNDGMYLAQSKLLIDRKKEMKAREATIQASGLGAVGQFSAGMVGGIVDPLNLAVSFIPVGGEAYWAAKIGAAGSLAERVAIRAASGAAAGAVGAAALEPIQAATGYDLGDEYSAANSLHNIGFGAGLGSLFHVALGPMKEKAYAKRQALEKILEDSNPKPLPGVSGPTITGGGELQPFEGGEAYRESLPPEPSKGPGYNPTADMTAEGGPGGPAPSDAHYRTDIEAGVNPEMGPGRPTQEQLNREPLRRQHYERVYNDYLKEIEHGNEDAPNWKGITPEDHLAAKAIADLENINYETRMELMRGALAQMLDGREVDVTPIIRREIITRDMRMEAARAQDPAAFAVHDEINAKIKEVQDRLNYTKESQDLVEQMKAIEERRSSGPELTKAEHDALAAQEAKVTDQIKEYAAKAGDTEVPVDQEVESLLKDLATYRKQHEENSARMGEAWRKGGIEIQRMRELPNEDGTPNRDNTDFPIRSGSPMDNVIPPELPRPDDTPPSLDHNEPGSAAYQPEVLKEQERVLRENKIEIEPDKELAQLEAENSALEKEIMDKMKMSGVPEDELNALKEEAAAEKQKAIDYGKAMDELSKCILKGRR